MHASATNSRPGLFCMAHINYVDGAFLQIHHFIKRTFRYYFRCQAYNKNIGVKQGDVKRGVLHSLF